MPDRAPLFVPMHLDAVFLAEDTRAVEPTADFSRLPYFDGQRDVHPDAACVSETITSPPFQNRNLFLARGVHLHWLLPTALARGVQRDGHGPEFPAVPTRWLVTRRRLQEGTWRTERRWIVESDFLHPEGHVAPFASPTVPQRPDPSRGRTAPFRHLGRCLPLAAWTGEGGPGDYLPELTAIGWGDTAFAAFYPNCSSVFGFHDPAVREPRGVRYEVAGWYARSDADPIQQLVAELDAAPLPDDIDVSTGTSTTRERRIWSEVMRRFGWDVSPDGTTTLPSRVLCFARMTFDGAEQPSAESPPRKLHLALGNTGPEALAAYVADRIAPERRQVVEDQLLAVLHDDGRDAAIDVGARFRQAVHEEGFLASSSGLLWSLRLEIDDRSPAESGSGDGAATAPPPALFAHVLEELNAAQRAHDDAAAELESLRQRLYADWYKVQLSTYPPRGTERELPDADQVRHYVDGQSLREVQARQRALGRLATRRGGPGASDSARAEGGTGTLAAEVALQIRRCCELLDRHDAELVKLREADVLDWPALAVSLAAAPMLSAEWTSVERTALQDAATTRSSTPEQRVLLLTALNRGIVGPDPNHVEPNGPRIRRAGLVQSLKGLRATEPPAWRLRIGPGPRDWQPRDPSVLVAGAGIRLPDRARPRTDGKATLRCRFDPDFQDRPLRTRDDLHDLEAFFDRLGETVDGEPDAAHRETGSYRWSPESQRPFLLEWEVEVLPLQRTDVADPFPEDLIRKHFRLAENSVELSPLPGKSSITRESNLYSGRTVMTPFAGISMGRRIETFVERILLDDFAARRRTDPEQADPFGLADRHEFDADQRLRFDEIVAWYAASPWRTQRELVDTLLSARAFLATPDGASLSQSLGGLHEALAMRRESLQLDVEDPIGFDDHRPLTEAIAAALGDRRRNAPQPLTRFHPIRTGVLKIQNLRLVDTFGRTEDLVRYGGEHRLITPRHFTTPLREDLAWLAPRICQPARLDFRWLAATLPGQESNDHDASTPLHGWLVPNLLSGSLLVFDADGQALGSLDRRAVWRPAPGDRETRALDETFPPTLLRIVRSLQRGSDGELLQDFLDLARNALENIDPEDAERHASAALLTARPIAVVRARLDLRLRGLPPVDHSWNAFRDAMGLLRRDRHEFRDVSFPIRVGDYGQLDDGLVGYWIEEPESGDQAPTVFPGPLFVNDSQHADVVNNPIPPKPGADVPREPAAGVDAFLAQEGPVISRFEFLEAFPETGERDWARLQSAGRLRPRVLRHSSPELVTDAGGEGVLVPRQSWVVRLPDSPDDLQQSIDAAPTTLTMLVDPRGPVHATCGILPSKSIRIPDQLFAPALRSLAATFLTAPLLGPEDAIHIPLPTDADGEWSFVAKVGEEWLETAREAIHELPADARFEHPNVLREGWLRVQQNRG